MKPAMIVIVMLVLFAGLANAEDLKKLDLGDASFSLTLRESFFYLL